MAGFSLLSSFAYLFYGLGVDILKKMNSDLMKKIESKKKVMAKSVLARNKTMTFNKLSFNLL